MSRRAAILDARRHANSLGYGQPEHDHGGLFLTFKRPMIFFPDCRPPAQIPQLPIPTDPTERIIVLVSDKAPAAAPWLPTVAQQDAAWWDEFGEAQQNRANAAGFARGFSVHWPDLV